MEKKIASSKQWMYLRRKNEGKEVFTVFEYFTLLWTFRNLSFLVSLVQKKTLLPFAFMNC